MKVECIDNMEGLKGLEAEWNALFKADGRCCLTMSYDWQLTWWEVFGYLGQLRLLTAQPLILPEKQLHHRTPWYQT